MASNILLPRGRTKAALALPAVEAVSFGHLPKLGRHPVPPRLVAGVGQRPTLSPPQLPHRPASLCGTAHKGCLSVPVFSPSAPRWWGGCLRSRPCPHEVPGAGRPRSGRAGREGASHPAPLTQGPRSRSHGRRRQQQGEAQRPATGSPSHGLRGPPPRRTCSQGPLQAQEEAEEGQLACPGETMVRPAGS